MNVLKEARDGEKLDNASSEHRGINICIRLGTYSRNNNLTIYQANLQKRNIEMNLEKTNTFIISHAESKQQNKREDAETSEEM